MIDASSVRRLDKIGASLAKTYQVAFAGEPWFERSRCPTDSCDRQFCAEQPGTNCLSCGVQLGDAYNADELVENWRTIVRSENGRIEIASEDQIPVRATIARSTDASELFNRKYSDVPAMEPWLRQNLNEDFVWIEDTFADRERSPTGNLRGRGDTLGRLAREYNGLPIATRTLSPAVVYATARDKYTEIYIGSENQQPIISAIQRAAVGSVVDVPDRRTLLIVGRENSSQK